MNQAEIDSIKRKVQAIEDVLNYRGAVKKAMEKHLPAPPALNLDDNLLMYEDMSPEDLQIEKRQLQEKENLLLRAIPPPSTVVQHNEPEVSESRKRRWSELNIVLEINKKAAIRQDGVKSTGYSYVSWKQVEHIFSVIQGSVGVSSLTSSSSASHDVSDELLDALVNYLSYASICFGSITEGHEAKRVHFIAPVIIIVCSSFNGDIQILAEEDIDGNRVHAHGHFEFVLKRGDKRVCIVEAKKDDILQGKTQSLVGCESLSDVENLDTVYGIATNYLEWCFLKNDPDNVTEEILTVQLENNKPTKESLRKIASKICHILT